MTNLIQYARKTKKDFNQLFLKLGVKHNSCADNIYHCCVQKTASQWIKEIFSDPRVLKYSGLSTYNYEATQPKGFDPRKLTEKYIEISMPKKTIVTPLYLDFASFKSIPKPRNYKGFFIYRDPRDIITSWYFSMKYSHGKMGLVESHREKLNSLSLDDGLIYCIKCQENYGVFKALESWIDAQKIDSNVQVIKFEEITGKESFTLFKKLFTYLDILIPETVLKDLLADLSFEKKSQGRKQGQENQLSHYRKGTSGDWQNYFNQKTLSFFQEVTGDLVARLDYM